MLRPVVLDKSYVQGTSAEYVKQLYKQCRVLIPDVLLYELFLAPGSTRARCLRKLWHGEPILNVVMGVGVLFRFELNERSPCTPLDGRFVVKVKLADSLFDSGATLTHGQTQYLNRKEGDLCTQTLDAISIWRTVDRFFPQLHGVKPGGYSEAVSQARNVIANNAESVRQIYNGIQQQWRIPHWFPAELPAAHLIGPNWAVYRWLQVNLLAAIDILTRYPADVVPKAQKRTNEYHDLEYAVTAALIGGLATKDDAMAERFRLLCPKGLLV